MQIVCICFFLAAISFVVFAQTVRHEFINYDDNLYVYANPLVISGFTLQGFGYFFTHYACGFYTPLTMISHMADCQFYGLRPGWHHLTNILLHTTTTILLFLILRQMTRAAWRSAFVAAVFAIHPLHVESVAWVAERNDMLAGLFFVLTMAAYLRYVQRRRSLASYMLVVLLFTAGLLCKPTLVTLPFLLLLFDYWPLGRFAKNVDGESYIMPSRQLLIEKIPLLILSVAASAVAYFAEGKSVAPVQISSLAPLAANALVSYIIYLDQMIHPSGLAIFYPRANGGLPLWEIVFSFVLLICVSCAVFVTRKKWPYLAVGWSWYLIVMVPMIGIVQVGEFAHADRYAYLSQIGLYIALTWGVADLARFLHLPRVLPGIAVAVVIGGLMMCSTKQVSYWRDSETVFRHALNCTAGNYVACNNLGEVVYQKGREHLEEAIAIFEQGLGYREASAPLHDNLGLALYQEGDLEAAIRHYRRSLEIQPYSAVAHYNLGGALLAHREPAAAIDQWQQSVKIQPQNVEALGSMAWVLATSPDDSLRDGTKAVELSERADEISRGKNSIVLRTLAAAYAETGRYLEAISAANRAARLADAQGDTSQATAIRGEIARYQKWIPLRPGGQGSGN